MSDSKVNDYTDLLRDRHMPHNWSKKPNGRDLDSMGHFGDPSFRIPSDEINHDYKTERTDNNFLYGPRRSEQSDEL